MSLKQIEVTKCIDCPFRNWEHAVGYAPTPECNLGKMEINELDKTPSNCPLLKYDFTEVTHINN